MAKAQGVSSDGGEDHLARGHRVGSGGGRGVGRNVGQHTDLLQVIGKRVREKEREKRRGDGERERKGEKRLEMGEEK